MCYPSHACSGLLPQPKLVGRLFEVYHRIIKGLTATHAL
jgi:hypothetical protein